MEVTRSDDLELVYLTANARSHGDCDAQEWRQKNGTGNVTRGTRRAYCSAMTPKAAAASQKKNTKTPRARKAPTKVAAKSRARTPKAIELGIDDLHPVLKAEVLQLAHGDRSRVGVVSRTEAIIRNH